MGRWDPRVHRRSHQEQTMTNVSKQFRYGRTVIEEKIIDGVPVVFRNGSEYPGNFHEAIVAAKQAPLISMRDECRRLVKEARAHLDRVRREDGLDGHDIEEIEHDDY